VIQIRQPRLPFDTPDRSATCYITWLEFTKKLKGWILAYKSIEDSVTVQYDT